MKINTISKSSKENLRRALQDYEEEIRIENKRRERERREREIELQHQQWERERRNERTAGIVGLVGAAILFFFSCGGAFAEFGVCIALIALSLIFIFRM